MLTLANDTMKMNIFRLHSPNVKFDDEFKWEIEVFEIDNFNLSAKRTAMVFKAWQTGLSIFIEAEKNIDTFLNDLLKTWTQ